MSLEKVTNTTPYIKPVATKPVTSEPQKATQVEDKGLNNASKYMIGATVLAATIAIGIAGHKNNWWRKAVQEGENITTSTHNPQRSVAPEVTAPHVNTPNIRTAEEAAAEFTRVAEREIQELAPNKTIVADVLAEIEEFTGKHPVDVLTAKNLRYEADKGTFTILNEEGKTVKRLIFLRPTEFLGDRFSKPGIIEYFNPETGKLTKIVNREQDNIWSVRMLDDTGENLTRELFVNNEGQSLLILKDYTSKNIFPDKVTVFDSVEDKVLTNIEYNLETGYPKVAYSEGRVYTPRENNTTNFGDITSTPDNMRAKTLEQFFGVSHSVLKDFITPRYTRGGYIVKHGAENNLELFDPVTRKTKYTLSMKNNDLMFHEIESETMTPKTLWIENGEVVGNKFEKSPKEVLEEMKEIFADLTPDLYPETSTKAPQLIQEFLEKLV